MDFRIADSFQGSLARLTNDEQKAAKLTAYDLQANPASPGLSFHKLEKARDPNFWSVRVGSDLRLIVHRTAGSLLLCYVDHHDKAYQWAERRKLETHPTTGAAQFVEIREVQKDVVIPTYIQAAAPAPASKAKRPLFADLPDASLLAYGVPAEWLADVRRADDDSLLALADRLPSEAAEALLELATGGTPQTPRPAAAGADPFAHPDAQRRFRSVGTLEELQQALDYPWDKWTVFLHPAQRELVELHFNGPAKVSGSAGTGKTIVALHRAVHLARANPDSRVLLTTFSETLANALRTRLRRLLSNEPRLGERLEVHALDALGLRLYESQFGKPGLATRAQVSALLAAASKAVPGHKFTLPFLRMEWEQVVDAWQVDTWEAYRDVKRLGRKTRLSEQMRQVLWSIFQRVRAELASAQLTTLAHVFSRLAASVADRRKPPFEFAVVDEAQDLTVAHLRFLAALGGDRPNSLFFAGDLGQRIFQQPFSWKALGVEVTGRSRTLRVNYRTSHQIRTQADRLLAPELTDADGDVEQRKGTVSVFNGVPPTLQVSRDAQAEERFVGQWIADLVSGGVQPHEIGVFVRSDAQLDRARTAVTHSGLAFRLLDLDVETVSGQVSIGTMHLAKGLEFKAVVAMACDDEVLPLQERIETVADEADLKDVYNTVRHLLYVACTRARDQLLVTGVDPPAEFIADMETHPATGAR